MSGFDVVGAQTRVCGTLASRGSRQGRRAEVTSRLGSNGSLFGERRSAARITYQWMAPAASPREVPWVEEAARHPPSGPLRLSARNAASAPSRSRPPCRGQAEAHPVSDAVRWARSTSCHRLFDGARCLAVGPATHAYDVKPGGGAAIRGRTVSRHRSRGEPMRFGTAQATAGGRRNDHQIAFTVRRQIEETKGSLHSSGDAPLWGRVAPPPVGLTRASAVIRSHSSYVPASPQARPDRGRESSPTVISLRRAVDRVQAGGVSRETPAAIVHRAGMCVAPGRSDGTARHHSVAAVGLPGVLPGSSRPPLAGSGPPSHERAGKGLPWALTNRSVPWSARGP
jgi:hypothetical protein